MPKLLFYLGVIACAVASALLVGATAGTASAFITAFLLGDLAPLARLGALPPLYLLVLIVPVAAIFLRMSSLLAVRDLFAAQLANFAILSAGLTASFLCALDLRLAASLRREAVQKGIEGSAGLADLASASHLLLCWFIGVTFLALRPYFRIHASPLLGILVYVPILTFGWMALAEAVGSPQISAAMAFWSIVAALLLGSAVHCLGHRHLFLEVTNLREVLDGIGDPATRRSGGVAPLRGDIAFDG